MFGVMKNRSCSQSDEQKYEYRLHYCGTCKTMGALFGQASRFLLNNDAVFLAEVLSAVTPAKTDISDWKKEYQSFNCFALPADPREMPLSLTIAANVTMVLTEFKLTDHIIDSEKKHWKTVRKLFSKKFEQASTALESMSFPLDELWRWFEKQLEHERFSGEYAETHFPRQLIDYCAKPTAHMTAIVFESGARAVGCADEANLAEMRKLGAAFGKLVYVLDAIDDFAKDMRRKEFNPFAVAYSIDSTTLPEHCRQDVYPYLQSLAMSIEQALDKLNIEASLRQQFRSRLLQNITDKLGTDWQEYLRSVCSAHAHTCSTVKQSVKLSAKACNNARLNLQQKRETAFEISQRLQADSKSIPDVFINFYLYIVAFLFPYHARQAKTREQVFGLPFNLIAWGALVSDLLWLAPQKLNYAFAMSAGSGSGGIGGGGTSGAGDAGDSGGSGSETGGSSSSSGSGSYDGGGAASGGGDRGRRWGGRRRRRFGEKEPSETLPDLVETPDPNSDPNADPNAPHDPQAPDPQDQPQNFSRRRRRPGVPIQQYPSNYFCNQLAMNCGCNLCANCACNICEDIACAEDCCDCVTCCGDCGSGDCAGIDCCAGVDCCSGSDCAAAGDCCSGCGDCADCAGGCGDCAGGCGDCSC
ncbi:MAG: hypothetical protein JST89_18175 [Cyanobacteria bacterium SZAS-4]|nr:hypothetical protein [Cyanobacteria bacterium SZAS-4]